MTADPRNTTERVCFIANPRSANGATGARLDALRTSADAHFAAWELWQTEGPRHARELATRALRAGFDGVVAVGGDGTAHEVIDGWFEDGAPIRPEAFFTVVPAGTGSDLVRTLGMPSGLDEAVAVVARGETRVSDAVRCTLRDHQGGSHLEHAINVVGVGLSGEVVHQVNLGSKRLGPLTFGVATARALARWESPVVQARWEGPDGAGSWGGELFTVFIANGAYCGGGMWIGRGGSMQDGLLDVTIVPRLTWSSVGRNAARLFSGDIHKVPGVVRVRATEIALEGPASVRVDLDGEQPGVLPLTVRALAGAVRIRGRWPA